MTTLQLVFVTALVVAGAGSTVEVVTRAGTRRLTFGRFGWLVARPVLVALAVAHAAFLWGIR